MPACSSQLRTFLIAVVTSLMAVALSASPLDAYHDKNRVVLIYLPSSASIQKFSADFLSHRKAIEERDLIFIDISPSATKIPRTMRMTDEQTVQLQKQFLRDANINRTEFVLIGKDGGEKARQSDALDLTKWFALIDQMPMRREEMKRRKS